MEYGLVGENLSHSYSKIIHTKFGMQNYNLYNISLEELKNILKMKKFKGLNVTMPYKKSAISFCDQLSNNAKSSCSVNTLIVDKNNVLTGHNTDYFGLKYTINRSNISLKNKKVIILGNGGTSATAQVLAKNLHAKEILVFSSHGTLNYKNIYEYSNSDIIINTTPVGMYPKNGKKLINIRKFKNLCGVVDVIYNPLYTKLLLEAKMQKIPIAGGLPMLVAQAKASEELFQKAKINNFLIEKVLMELAFELCNLVFIGMPGSGKTTIAKIISKKLGKSFIDSDIEIEKEYGLKIPKIFEKYGEKEFRKLESKVLKNIGKLNGICLSTGGGAAIKKSNYYFIKQNSRVYWIKRSLDELERKGRPLSKSLSSIYKIYQSRENAYQSFSDKIIKNNESLSKTINLILKDFYEHFCC